MLRFVPGSELKTFVIRPRAAQTDAGGRVSYAAGEARGEVKAAICAIKPGEAMAHGQTEHPVTHRLVMRGRIAVAPGDVLERGEERYYVRDVRDAGMLGMFTIARCERRRL